MNDRNARLDRIEQKMLDALERLVESMARKPEPALPAPTLPVIRRQVANELRLWRFCARATCRRSACCRGEPSECLRYGAPLLPPEALTPPRKARVRRGR